MIQMIIVFASPAIIGVVAYVMGRSDGYLARVQEEALKQLEAKRGKRP